ncbi:uncharacterized protein LOC128787183 [Vidua chalybeata]|uniref:uncharacterized protein LOC128787183 n=1 Tax=Vidua chalybeata TaxID=81927 RepID=UPI0023A86407|nr:uncharacterized protein LOC128787183 [Vidua chalybeata]
MRKNLTVRVTEHWNRLSREGVEPPSLEKFKNRAAQRPQPPLRPRTGGGGPGRPRCPERGPGTAHTAPREAAAGRGVRRGRKRSPRLPLPAPGRAEPHHRRCPPAPRPFASLPFPFPGTAAAVRRSGGSNGGGAASRGARAAAASTEVPPEPDVPPLLSATSARDRANSKEEVAREEGWIPRGSLFQKTLTPGFRISREEVTAFSAWKMDEEEEDGSGKACEIVPRLTDVIGVAQKCLDCCAECVPVQMPQDLPVGNQEGAGCWCISSILARL